MLNTKNRGHNWPLTYILFDSSVSESLPISIFTASDVSNASHPIGSRLPERVLWILIILRKAFPTFVHHT